MALSAGPVQPGALHAARHDARRGASLFDHLGIDRAPTSSAPRWSGSSPDPGRCTEPQRVASLQHHHVDHRQTVAPIAGVAMIRLALGRARRRRLRRGRTGLEYAMSRCSTAPTSCRARGSTTRARPQRAERSHYPPGMLRQFDAVLGTGSLLAYSKANAPAPTVVLHGPRDLMVRPRNGRRGRRGDPAPRSRRRRRHGPRPPEPVWRPIVEPSPQNPGPRR